MNNKYIYIPISAVVILAIGILSLEINHFSRMTGFLNLAYLSGLATILLTVIAFFSFRKNVQGQDFYTLIGSVILFSFVVFLAFISLANRHLATDNCKMKEVTVLHYEERYASGYGKLTTDKIKPNQWVITILYEGKEERYSLRKNIINDSVTNPINLEFCFGMLETKYIRD